MSLPRQIQLERIPDTVIGSGFLRVERLERRPTSQDLGGRIIEMSRITDLSANLLPVDELYVRQESPEQEGGIGSQFSTYYPLGHHQFTPVTIITSLESYPYGLVERVAMLSVHLQDPDFRP